MFHILKITVDGNDTVDIIKRIIAANKAYFEIISTFKSRDIHRQLKLAKQIGLERLRIFDETDSTPIHGNRE